MKPIKVGLIREEKVPVDRRVALTPQQAAYVQQTMGGKVYCQPSEHRCYTDQAYQEKGIEVVEDLSHCDILLGVKEVPIPTLMPGKTYLFFSHTIKKQAYNRKLLQAILQKNIRLIDYERLTDAKGKRIVAFGRFAGIVGAYNGLYTYGKKYDLYHIRRVKDCFDYQDLRKEYAKIELPAIKIALTGGGRVAKGAMEVLDGIGIKKVDAVQYLKETFREPVYTQLEVTDYNRKREVVATADASEVNHAHSQPFSKQEFYRHPERFESGFTPYARATDLLIAGAYWDNRAPVLFHREDMLKDTFKIKVIADITCDIAGSIPSTKKPSTIAEPVYDYDATFDQVVDQPFENKQRVSVMAIDNLPSELPRDASKAFGEKLIKNVLLSLLGQDSEHIIRRATIAEHGRLTSDYHYLQDYVDGALS